MSTRQRNQRNQNQTQNMGKDRQRVTRSQNQSVSSSSSSSQFEMTPYLKKIYDGEHRNFMYFHENGNQKRRIAVVFAYNYQTGRGDFTGAMWHYDPKEGEQYIPWDKAKHRQTAQRRYEMRDHIHFQVPFQICQDDFIPELRKAIRNTIRRKGLCGPRQDLLSDERLQQAQQPVVGANINASSLAINQSVEMKSSSAKRQRSEVSENFYIGEYLH